MFPEWKEKYKKLLVQIPELPFSNMWIAQKISTKLPEGSVFHLGIRNSIRSWNYFEVPQSVSGYCNTGGFGIDGGVSSLIGASMVHPDKLYFGFFGDLLFFYDMNSIGNRAIKSNLRILIVNNGLGQEFKNYGCYSSMFGDDTDTFIAARGHFGNQSRTLVKYYAENLGFEYLSAKNKEEFDRVHESFLSPEFSPKPMLFEIFTDADDESNALKLIRNISKDTKSVIVNTAKQLLGPTVKKVIKGIVK